MKSQLFVHIPIHKLSHYLPQLLEHSLQPEIACHEIALDKLDYPLLCDSAAQLQEKGLMTTLHAPFAGFSSGSSSSEVQQHSQRLVEQSLTLAQIFRASRIVFHPGLPPQAGARDIDNWLKHSCRFWPKYTDQAQSQETLICIENIYEQTPAPILTLLKELDSSIFGHIFDIGHWNIFSITSLKDWLDSLGPYLKHLHLHDNQGVRDDHLILNQGTAPLPEFYEWLKRRPELPTLTLENRFLEESLQSLQQLRIDCPDLYW